MSNFLSLTVFTKLPTVWKELGKYGYYVYVCQYPYQASNLHQSIEFIKPYQLANAVPLPIMQLSPYAIIFQLPHSSSVTTTFMSAINEHDRVPDHSTLASCYKCTKKLLYLFIPLR